MGVGEADLEELDEVLVEVVEVGLVDAVVVFLVETLLVLLLAGVALMVATKTRHAVRSTDWKCMVNGAMIATVMVGLLELEFRLENGPHGWLYSFHDALRFQMANAVHSLKGMMIS